MRVRRLAVLSLLLLPLAAAAAPNQPVLTVPVNATTVYNTRPWVKMTVSDGGGHAINHVLVRIDNRAGFCSSGNVLQQDSNSNRTTFYPLPAASGATITHRLVSALAPGTYYMCVYVYCDRAIGSGWSAERQFTVATPSWTDPPTVNSASTKIKAAHFNELYTAINNTRAYYNAGAYAWSDYPVTTAKKVRAVHMTDLRNALCGAYAAATGTACSLTFTDSVSTAIKVRSIHINELRTKVLLP